MALLRRRLAVIIALLFALAILAAGQKDEAPLVGKDLELKACGPEAGEVKYAADSDKTQHPAGTTAPDLALIYVIRTFAATKVPSRLVVDGEWKGVNKGHNYFFFNLKPGEHYFCYWEGRRVLVLTVEAGKTYYLAQEAHISWGSGGGTELELLDENEGQRQVAKAQFSTWTVK